MSGVDQARVLKFEKTDAPATWAQLTPQEQKCLVMAIVEAKSYKQIASDLGISRSRVASVMQTASRILRLNVPHGDRSVRTVAFWMGKNAQEIGL